MLINIIYGGALAIDFLHGVVNSLHYCLGTLIKLALPRLVKLLRVLFARLLLLYGCMRLMAAAVLAEVGLGLRILGERIARCIGSVYRLVLLLLLLNPLLLVLTCTLYSSWPLNLTR